MYKKDDDENMKHQATFKNLKQNDSSKIEMNPTKFIVTRNIKINIISDLIFIYIDFTALINPRSSASEKSDVFPGKLSLNSS